jgi:hypothetical protein
MSTAIRYPDLHTVKGPSAVAKIGGDQRSLRKRRVRSEPGAADQAGKMKASKVTVF